jgi:hypothetical protein
MSNVAFSQDIRPINKNPFNYDYKFYLAEADKIKNPKHQSKYLQELNIANGLYQAGIMDSIVPLQSEGAMKAFAYHQFYLKGNENYLVPILSDAYKHYPVDVKTFVEDPYFLGDCGVRVWEAVMAQLQEINRFPFTHEVGVREVLLGGAVGIGKTFQAAVSLAYTCYLLSCFENINVLFPNRSDKPFTIIMSSANLLQLKSDTFEQLLGYIDASPYFKEHTKRNKKKSTEIEFLSMPVNVMAVLPSRSKIVAFDIIEAFVDEVNQMEIIEQSVKVKGDGGSSTAYDQAKIFVDELLTRYDSRFQMRADKPLPKIGRIMQASSANYIDDFLDKKFKDSEANPTKKVVCCKLKLWEAKPANSYSGETFKFLIGTSDIEARVLTPSDIEGIDYPQGAMIEEVPIEEYSTFKSDPNKAQREYMGMPTSTSTRLFQSQTGLLQSTYEFTEHIKKNSYIRQFLREKNASLDMLRRDTKLLAELEEEHGIEPSFVFKTDLFVKYIMRENVNYRENGMFAVNPTLLPMDLKSPRFVHVDLARTGDACGLAIVKIAGTKINASGEYIPIYMVEFAGSIQPSKEAPLEPSHVRKFIQDLKHVYGFNIYKVSYDSMGSTESIELLKQNRINSEVISVDRELLPYEYFKDAINDSRVLLYNNEILAKELVYLERTKTSGHEKIDHPAGSGHSKDISDAVCGAIYSASKSRMVRSELAYDPEERVNRKGIGGRRRTMVRRASARGD